MYPVNDKPAKRGRIPDSGVSLQNMHPKNEIIGNQAEFQRDSLNGDQSVNNDYFSNSKIATQVNYLNLN